MIRWMCLLATSVALALPGVARPCSDIRFLDGPAEVAVVWPAAGAEDVPLDAPVLLSGSGLSGHPLASHVMVAATLDGAPWPGRAFAVPGDRELAWWVPDAPGAPGAAVEMAVGFDPDEPRLELDFTLGAAPRPPVDLAWLDALEPAACVVWVPIRYSPCEDTCGCPPGTLEVLERADRASLTVGLPDAASALHAVGLALTAGFGADADTALENARNGWRSGRANVSRITDTLIAETPCVALRVVEPSGAARREVTFCRPAEMRCPGSAEPGSAEPDDPEAPRDPPDGCSLGADSTPGPLAILALVLLALLRIRR